MRHNVLLPFVPLDFGCRCKKHLQRILFAATVLALASPCAAYGATSSWQVSSGNWSVASNWGQTAPSGGSLALIDNGGTASITQNYASCGTLSLGAGPDSGTVQLSGSGVLEAIWQSVGAASAGSFVQTGGVNYDSVLSIQNNGSYQLNGGTLSVTGGLANQGLFSGSAVPATILAGGILDFSGGSFQNLGNISVSVAANSLVILRAGFTPATMFSSYTNLGMTHVMGTTLNVPAQQGFDGTGTINDPVNCQGSITQATRGYASVGGAINLNGGLTLSGSGTIVLGGGSVTTNDSFSTITSGYLSSSSHYVGSGGTGAFSQPGGENSVANGLYLGYLAGNSGTYNLSGSGQLGAGQEYVGYPGTGSFAQSGGTNSASYLYLGFNAGSTGAYHLSGGQVNVLSESVGGGGAGSFVQSAGSNSVSLLSIQNTGNYQLAGGTLQINGALLSQGVLSGGNAAATLAVNGVLDLTAGSLENLSNVSLNMGTNSLLIVPAGYNVSAEFGSFASLGLTHTLGTTLNVPAGQGFVGWASISDPVNCQGSIAAAPSGAIDLSGPLTISGTGRVSLGNGNVITNDSLSTINGGTLYSSNHFVGSSGTGVFTQTAGSNFVNNSLYLGNNAADNGTYNLQGGYLSSSSAVYVGNSGTGTLTQTGGSSNFNALTIGNNAGSIGSYSLSGTGQLAGGQFEYVGYSGTGSFAQSGGTNSMQYGSLYLGYNTSGSGAYALNGGLLSPSQEQIGFSGSGSFMQSGGTNSVSSNLDLGVYPGSSGTYLLSGSGQFSAASALVGASGVGRFVQSGGASQVSLVELGLLGGSGSYSLIGGQLISSNEYVGQGGSGVLTQTGGSNSVATLSISNSGSYVLGGGTLQVSGLANQGLFAGGNIAAVLDGSGIVDLSGGTLQNTGKISVSMGANSLLIVPPGFSTATGFAGYSTLGLTQTLGTTLNVAGGQSINGSGTISDPVNNQGTISGGALNLTGGLILSGTGLVQLGSGSVTTNDSLSGISGGSLNASTQYVGYSGTGVFTQTGGASSVQTVILGQTAHDSGTYNLSGSSQLLPFVEYVGNYGTGSFVNAGGVNNISNTLYVGIFPGSNGSYALSGTGRLFAGNQYVGYSGSGSFTQSGGVNTINWSGGGIQLGYTSTGSGTYVLSGGGSINSPNEYVGYSGTGSFAQSGGTNTITSSDYYLSANLYLGYSPGSVGAYSLSGSGVLSAATAEYVGYASNASAQFQQTGGLNATSLLMIGSSGSYMLGGGTLQLQGSLVNQGVFMGDGAPATLLGSGVVDLSRGQDLSGLSVSMATNSLLIVPAGFNTATGFASYSSLGLTHTAGSTLNIAPGQSFIGSLSLSDPVNCQGTISAGNGTINLGDGLVISGAGSARLGTGSLTSNDSTSSLRGTGQLSGANQYVGSGGTGTFSQFAATNTLSGTLSLGVNASDIGTYALSGGSLYASYEVVGNSGNGALMHSGGTNTVTNNLYLGYNSGSSGVYTLSGSGLLSVGTLDVGYSGTGSFNHAGVASIGLIYLGYNPGSSGTYALSSGSLLTYSEFLGWQGTGNFTQSGGTISIPGSIYGALFVGYASTANNSYNLGAGLLNHCPTEYIGYYGTGSFTQTGGSNLLQSNGTLCLGYDSGTSGSYSLSGSSDLEDYNVFVGYSGTGSFTQSGGTHNLIPTTQTLTLGFNSGYNTVSYGSYVLTAGQMSFANEVVGASGSGSFSQSGGVNTVTGLLSLAANNGAYGFYSLQGGSLSATFETVAGPGAAALFQQTGGSNSTASLAIGSGGRYTFTAGTLNINTSQTQTALSGSGPGYQYGTGGGITGLGAIDLANGAGTILAGSNSVIDLSHAVLTNVGSMNVSIGANSLLIIPAGFNPSTAFHSFSFNGMTQIAETTLVVPAGQGFGGAGAINDPVNCQGSIVATASGYGKYLNLNNGLVLSGSGLVNLGLANSTSSGSTLTVNDSISGMSGGTLIANNENIGSSGTGTFSQSAGSNSVNYLYLGNLSSDMGTYNLVGGTLAGVNEYVGASGSGSFAQSGGTNSVSNALYVGSNAGASGSYNLSAGLLATSQLQVIGSSGSGSFTQSGGTNSATGLIVGNNAGSSGNYGLSDGELLSTSAEIIAYAGSGVFTQTGGTNNASGGLELTEGGVAAAGTYNLDGGLLITGSLTHYFANEAFNFNGGTLQANGNLASSLPINLGTSADPTIDNHGFAVTLFGTLSGPGSLTSTGSGMLTLTATNTFTGNMLVAGGTLTLGNPLALQQSTLDTSGAGRFNFGPYTAATLGGLTGNGTLALSNSASAAVALSAGNNSFNTTYAGALSGPGSLIKVGSGELLLTGSANSYTGGTTIAAGGLAIANTAALPGWSTPGAYSVAASAALAAADSISDANIATMLATGNFAAGAMIGFDTSGGSRTYAVRVAGALGLAKYGANTLLVTGSNTYSGETLLAGGVLEITNSASLGTGLISFHGGTLEYAPGLTYDISGRIDPSSGPVSIDTNGNNVTFASRISGSAGISKSVAGTLVLAASNAYMGGTSVSGGVLQLDNNGALGTGSLSVNGSGVLDLHGNQASVTSLAGNGDIINAANISLLSVSDGGTYTGTIQDGGLGGNGETGLALTGGLLLLGGSNDYTEGTYVTGGTLELLTLSAIESGTSLLVGDASEFSAVLTDSRAIASPTGSVALVPEPGTLLMAGFGFLLLVVSRRRPPVDCKTSTATSTSGRSATCS
jgi:autotransporter-associated beta strand protein